MASPLSAVTAAIQTPSPRKVGAAFHPPSLPFRPAITLATLGASALARIRGLRPRSGSVQSYAVDRKEFEKLLPPEFRNKDTVAYASFALSRTASCKMLVLAQACIWCFVLEKS
uniref:Uncharacterized protein n=1 Tax=Arundo donax TaxID=35708 RepID=A0A0A9CXB0_ARUDO